ncbi:MAG: hypothetical protein PHI83_01170 [Sphaerochaetaceae bacterium]|jgi:hypothetical protein|nr:hypothetical protein [Sphaerochaetaceae bacterium]
MRKTMLIIALALVLLASCKIESGLTLSVTIKGSGSKTIAPDSRLMRTARYSLSGKGPSSQFFGPILFEGPSVKVEGLAAGRWSLEAKALNAMDVELSSGKASVDLSKPSQELEISLEEIPGSGMLDVEITWNPDGILEPESLVIEAIVTDENNNTYTPQMTIDKAKGTARLQQTLQAGSYLLTVCIKQGEKNMGGAVEAVRIVQSISSTSTMEFTFNETGFVINDHTSLPLEGELEYEPIDHELQRLTFTASRSPDIHYLWFCQGQRMDTEDSPSIVTRRMPGTVRYNVVAYTEALGSWGSASILVTN